MWFFDKKLFWLVTIVGTILGLIMGIFTSREFNDLQTQLAQVKPTQAAAA